MSDMRCDIRIVFSIHGKVYKTRMNINYSPDDEGMDRRVAEFFQTSWEDSLSIYNEIIGEHERQMQEQGERETLARLKEKYESS